MTLLFNIYVKKIGMRNIKMFEDFHESHEELSDHKERKNYMFFQHLQTIKDDIEEILGMDQDMIDHLLSDGHDWAADHITTASDDVEEVYHFLKNRIHDHHEDTVSLKSVEIIEEPEELDIDDDEDDDEDDE